MIVVGDDVMIIYLFMLTIDENSDIDCCHRYDDSSDDANLNSS